jgi:hypothetical protein
MYLLDNTFCHCHKLSITTNESGIGAGRCYDFNTASSSYPFEHVSKGGKSSPVTSKLKVT